jgi:aminomethyltransferase
MDGEDSKATGTALHDLHVELGAKMVPFAGYAMPLQYGGGIIKEHNHTRQHAGLFDVSHMGQLRLSGEGAAEALESLVPVDVVGLGSGQQRYALFTNQEPARRRTSRTSASIWRSAARSRCSRIAP